MCGFAQSLSLDVITSSGAYFSNANCELSWTLGETVTETFSNEPKIYLTQGFNQSYSIITEVDDLAPNYTIKVYPNPASDWIIIEWKDAIKDDYIELYNSSGKLLEQIPILVSNGTHFLKMNTFLPGIYLLQINSKLGQKLKSCKIVKHK